MPVRHARETKLSDPKPSSKHHHHRQNAAVPLSTVVISVSDTRTLETDTGGATVAAFLTQAGHTVVHREIVKDEPTEITNAMRHALDRDDVRAIIFTGGTGVAPRDVTPDSIEPLLDRVIPGFGELFRMLSYADIGTAALLSRALAGIASGRIVFVLPGSRGAVTLAMEKLVLPEMGHLADEAVKTR